MPNDDTTDDRASPGDDESPGRPLDALLMDDQQPEEPVVPFGTLRQSERDRAEARIRALRAPTIN